MLEQGGACSLMSGALIRRDAHGGESAMRKHRGKTEQGEDGGRGWRDAAMGQGTLAATAAKRQE